MWSISYYNSEMKLTVFKSDYNGSILGAINDFYSKFGYKMIKGVYYEN